MNENGGLTHDFVVSVMSASFIIMPLWPFTQRADQFTDNFYLLLRR
ncbi:hypothetical protein SAMN05216563_10521 [Phytobacter palmae]|nr:hypothetical protein SAMN05216563_10521 [Phytobacter palmae]